MNIYKNVMEMLVEEEVERQLRALPAKTASYINPTDLVAYALNQLPSLYATSEKGLEYQLRQGKEKYVPKICQAVQRSIAAILRDPLRHSVPLQSKSGGARREVLHQLRLLLHNDKIDWETLPAAVEQALNRRSPERTWDPRQTGRMASGFSPLHRSSPFPQYSSPPAERPSSPNRSTKAASSAEAIDEEQSGFLSWEDPFYSTH